MADKDEKKEVREEPVRDEAGIKAIKCASCGGDLGKSSRTEGSGEDAEEIPIAKCLSCGKEYDQHTEEYYETFADTFTFDKDNTIFKLGLKGTLDGVEYEIIGRIRYQEEEETEKSTWDEWMAVSGDGTYYWFVEEDGEIYFYSDYVPQSINMEGADFIDFEGKKISKGSGFDARIVYSEGELTWKPETGEKLTCYDFKKDRKNYTIEQSEDEVSITQGVKVPHKKVIMAFRKEEYLEKFDSTVSARQRYKRKSLVYLVMTILAFGMVVRACTSGTPLKDITSKKMVLTDNQAKNEEGMTAFFSQVLYGPVDISRKNILDTLSVYVSDKAQPLHLEWQSYRVMMIKEDRIAEFLKMKTGAESLRELFEEVDALQDPIESYVFGGDFWDEEGYDDEGHWHESNTMGDTDFILDDPGKYYFYLELFSERPRSVDAVGLSLTQDVQSYRYYILAAIIFIILMLVSHYRGKSYNELPFKMSEE